MECPSCGIEIDLVCHNCGYIRNTVEIEKGMLIDGGVQVIKCDVRHCVLREGDTTTFCKFLLNLKPVADGYLVECDPIFRGEVIQ